MRNGWIFGHRPVGAVATVEPPVSQWYVRRARIAFLTVGVVSSVLAAVVLSVFMPLVSAVLFGVLTGLACGLVAGVLVAAWPVLRVLWWWAVEITALVAGLLGPRLLDRATSPCLALTAVLTVAALCVLVHPVRRFLTAWVWCLVVRHRLRLCFAGIVRGSGGLRPGTLPLVLWAHPTPAGERAWLWLRPGLDLADLDAILPPPPELDAEDLVAVVDHAAKTVAFTTEPHPARTGGWRIGWGEQVLTKVITVAAEGQVTDAQVAAYLAKYATKSTEITGHVSTRLSEDTIGVYADPDGSHTERLVEACWQLGRPRQWRGLRRWAHMLGFGGHFLTKSRRYSITFALLRNQRIFYRRTQTSGPERDPAGAREPTTLVVNFLQFVGAGWKTPADAMLANTSAAMAREHQEGARQYLQTQAA